MDNIGYCVKCKMERPIANAKEGTTKNNKRILKGLCPICGTKILKFLPKDPANVDTNQ